MAETPKMVLGVSPEALRARLRQLAGRKVVVIGDPVLDVYLYGTTHRISREAPVLIVREDARESRLGGAGNAAANLAALGAKALFVGITGDDTDVDILSGLFDARGIDHSGLIRVRGRHTVTKTRVLAGGVHTTKQQMLRIDRENEQQPGEPARAALGHQAREAIAGADALVISDYGAAGLSELYAAVAREAVAAGLPVVVDSRFSLEAYSGVTALTPNAPEAEAALGTPLDDQAAAARGAETLLGRLGVGAVILTRGREGMIVADRSGTTAIAAHGAKEAVDVTGAGDTVTATFTLALAAGAPVLEAAVLANCAASVVVQKVGAATLDTTELAASAAQWDPAGLAHLRA